MGKRKQGRSPGNALLKKDLAPTSGENFIGMLAQVIEKMRATPEHQAEELCVQGELSEDPRERAKLARRALDLAPDCSHAYLLLAHDAETDEAALPLLDRAVSAAAKDMRRFGCSLDDPDFECDEYTEEYFIARSALAMCLHRMGRSADAEVHLNGLLELDSEDGSSVRYLLASLLMEVGKDEQADGLLRRYQRDGSAIWLFVRALLAFRRQGDCVDSRKVLKRAVSANTRIPELLCTQPKPGIEKELDELDDELQSDLQEAALFLAIHGKIWFETPGAIEWLGSNWKRPSRMLGE